MKEAGLAARLVYDTHERRSGLVRFLPMDATPKDWADAAVTELGDALDRGVRHRDARTRLARRRPRRGRSRSAASRRRVRLTKRLRLGGDRREPTLELGVDVENTGSGRGRCPARHRVDDDDARRRRQPGSLVGGRRRAERARRERPGRRGPRRLAQGNDYIGIAIETTVSSPADAWWAPVETISNSEQRLRARLPGQRAAAVLADRARPRARAGRSS